MKVIFTFLLLALPTSILASPYEHLNASPTPRIDEREQRIKKEAVELESVLVSKMIEPMFPDGKESGLYGGGHGSDIFRQMMIDQYARTIAETNGLGLAEAIAKDLNNKR